MQWSKATSLVNKTSESIVVDVIDKSSNNKVTMVTVKQPSTPLRKVITKDVKQLSMSAGSPPLGYTKRYFHNVNTGRPNQVFICSMCAAQRPKISKMIKHMNIHKKQRNGAI